MNGEMSTASTGRTQPFVWRLPALLIAAMFVFRVLGWMFSDLWFDEVITLSDYAVGPPVRHSLWRVFRTYPVANNHILFSALLWVWVRITGFTVREWVLRLPSVVFGGLAVWYAARQWRRFVGAPAAHIAALILALSPVVAPFMWQLRGYALSVFLAVLAGTAALEVTEGCNECGEPLGAVTCMLLPLVIPSNFLVVLALALFVFSAPDPMRPPLKQRVRRAAFLMGPGLLGAAYYLTLGPQFFEVLRKTGGWDNPWAVDGHLAAAFAVHAAPLLLLLIHLAASPHRRRQAFVWTEGAPPGYLAVCCAAVIVMAPALRRPAPFPRVFLPFFPLLTLSAARMVRRHDIFRSSPNVLVLALVTAAWALAVERITTWRTRTLVRDEGVYVQNLLCQYYRGSTGLSQIAAALAQQGRGRNATVLVGFHDFPTFRFYWSTIFGLPAQNVFCRECPTAGAALPLPFMDSWRIFAVAATPEQAALLFRDAGYPGPFREILAVEDRSLYVLPGDELLIEERLAPSAAKPR